MIVRSASTPWSCWAPPRATRKPEITSSSTRSAPQASACSRRNARKPASGGTTPMFAGTGSQMIAAGSCSAAAAATASRSFHGTTIVSAACAAVTPGLAGMPWVARPDPASASRPSTWPWYAPANLTILSRPVAARASRIALIDASVPGVHHPHHLDRTEAVAHLGRELHLALGRGPVARPALGRLADRLDDRGMSVAEDQRAPGAHPVDVAVAVDVDQLEALAALDEDRVVAADRAHRPNGRVDPARQEPRGPREEHLGARAS